MPLRTNWSQGIIHFPLKTAPLAKPMGCITEPEHLVWQDQSRSFQSLSPHPASKEDGLCCSAGERNRLGEERGVKWRGTWQTKQDRASRRGEGDRRLGCAGSEHGFWETKVAKRDLGKRTTLRAISVVETSREDSSKTIAVVLRSVNPFYNPLKEKFAVFFTFLRVECVSLIGSSSVRWDLRRMQESSFPGLHLQRPGP